MDGQAREKSVDLSGIHAWAGRLRELQLVEEEGCQRLEQALSESERSGLAKPQEPLLTVMLFGPSGVGKSQLLNALAGEVIATSHYVRPTTRVPTVYAHESVSAERLFEYGTNLGEMASRPATFHEHRRQELINKVIIDAPDIDSYCREHRELVMQLQAPVAGRQHRWRLMHARSRGARASRKP